MQPVRDVTFAKRLRNPFRRTRLRVIRQPDRVLLKVVGGRKRHRKTQARVDACLGGRPIPRGRGGMTVFVVWPSGRAIRPFPPPRNFL